MYVQQEYSKTARDTVVLNVFSLITRLFSTMSFAATDIFFKVIKAYIVIKGLRIKLRISCINYP